MVFMSKVQASCSHMKSELFFYYILCTPQIIFSFVSACHSLIETLGRKIGGGGFLQKEGSHSETKRAAGGVAFGIGDESLFLRIIEKRFCASGSQSAQNRIAGNGKVFVQIVLCRCRKSRTSGRDNISVKDKMAVTGISNGIARL